MTNIMFPKTNVVGCVFSYRGGGNRSDWLDYDKYDHVCMPSKLKVYYYQVSDELKGQLKVGDAVVVHCQTGYQICEVRELDAMYNVDKKFELAPVVCKVDLSSWAEAVEKKERLTYMKRELDKEMKRLQSQVTYDLIAEKHPEFKEMLEAYKAEGGEF